MVHLYIHLNYLRLYEAEQRFMNREARPEDVELIQKLKDKIAKQEMKHKEILVSNFLPSPSFSSFLYYSHTVIMYSCPLDREEDM